MDTTEGPARFFPGGRLKFEDNGRRSGAALLIVQWQNGEPKVVYPAASAMAKPVWSKK
jgi:branched-chain amino acid transport system substrate-binding protein